ncbi:UvrD-helicase domain-containing protein [Peribacillus butanolivorans]|uniref:UvrD-helicase domain-containing protein n=1 Tax=Peribacillus butanolivorans TaxID=421767 RepID=UPI0030C9F4DE
MNILEQLKTITPRILPPGCDFFSQQKEAISAGGSIDVVAGPGSGKTTVLIAKCGLLLNETAKSDKGTCLITHTNVAVDEIRTGLTKIGINDIEYPNFIGTIQEFFNNFFAKKAFHLILGEKKFRVLDDEEYQEKFEELFDQRKPDWYDGNNPKANNWKPKVIISDNLSYTIESNARPSYKNAFNESIRTLFSWGIVTNHQCLELSKWYINRYGVQFKKAMSNRFKYVLLDEAQDTSYLQFEMLNYLFSDEEISFQKFGDPYQALYNIFDGNNDAWIPTKQIGANYREISETSRFGNSIANVVKNVCVEKYDSFTSLNIIASFDPHYIIYNDEKDLIKKYRDLINYYEMESDSFSNSRKKDAILSPFHNDLIRLFSVYTKPSSKERNNQSPIKKIFHFLVDLFSKEEDIPFMDTRKKIESSLYCKTILSKCIMEVVNRDLKVISIIDLLEAVLSDLTNGEKTEFSKVSVESQIDYFRHVFFSSMGNESEEKKNDSDFYIGTVHSAKGETHRSTLLVLNTKFTNYQNNTELLMFELLTGYLLGNYTDPKEIVDDIEKNETIKSLKLAYVALSRPTHLMAIAIPENIIKDNNTITRLNQSGWRNLENYVYA